MDYETARHFEAHVNEVLRRAIDGDSFAIKTLACMALIREGHAPDDGEGSDIVYIRKFLKAA